MRHILILYRRERDQTSHQFHTHSLTSERQKLINNWDLLWQSQCIGLKAFSSYLNLSLNI